MLRNAASGFPALFLLQYVQKKTPIGGMGGG